MGWNQDRLNTLHLIKKGKDDMSNQQWLEYKAIKRQILILIQDDKVIPDDLWEKYNQLVRVAYPSIGK